MNVLRLDPAHRRLILGACSAALPDEACGLLATLLAPRDDGGLAIARVYPCPNAAASPHGFHIAPDDIRAAADHAHAHGLHLAGSWHSHPGGRAWPSATDARRSPDPEWLHLIVGLAAVTPTLGAFTVSDAGDVLRVPILTV